MRIFLPLFQNLFKHANKSVENGCNYIRMDGWMAWWMGGLPTGGRVGRRKSQHVWRQSLWSIVCNAPLLFSLQQQNQEENAKKKVPAKQGGANIKQTKDER